MKRNVNQIEFVSISEWAKQNREFIGQCREWNECLDKAIKDTGIEHIKGVNIKNAAQIHGICLLTTKLGNFGNCTVELRREIENLKNRMDSIEELITSNKPTFKVH